MSMLKKGDVIVAAIVLLVSFSLIGYKYVNQGNEKKAIIKYKGEIYKEFKLSEDLIDEVNIKGKYNAKIIIKDGKLKFHSSNCPEQICVTTGWLEDFGDTAICIPNELSITIVGDEKSEEVDEVTF